MRSLLIESRASFLVFTDHGQLWLETIDRGALIEIPLCVCGPRQNGRVVVVGPIPYQSSSRDRIKTTILHAKEVDGIT